MKDFGQVYDLLSCYSVFVSLRLVDRILMHSVLCELGRTFMNVVWISENRIEGFGSSLQHTIVLIVFVCFVETVVDMILMHFVLFFIFFVHVR